MLTHCIRLYDSTTTNICQHVDYVFFAAHNTKQVVEHHVEDTITAKHRRDARAGRAPHLSFSPQTIQARYIPYVK